MSENVNAVQNAAGEEKSFISRTSGLKTRDYVAYAMGDTACCLVFGLVTSFLQKFYTDIFSLSPLFIMLMFIGARVWDAINDPIMGRIADTVKLSKWGRYRPWFLWAAGPLIISTVLMFIRWPGLTGDVNYVGTCIYATVTYVMFGMSYTMLQIPYGSLASVVTTDEKERTTLSVFRSIGAGVGSVPAVLIASFCYKEVGVNEETGRVISEMQYVPIIIGVAVISAIALGMEAVESDVMNHPPKPKDESLFAHGFGVLIVLQGCMFAALTLGAYFIGEAITGGDPAGGSTLAFLVLSLSQIVHAYNMRSDRSLFKIGPFSNKKLNLVTVISVLLIAFVMFVPGVVEAFNMTYIPWYGYLIGVGFSFVSVVVLEIFKAAGLVRHGKKHD